MGHINFHWTGLNENVVRRMNPYGDKAFTFKEVKNRLKRFLPVMGNGTGFLLGAAYGYHNLTKN